MIEKGFATVWIVLITAVISLAVGAAGYAVYDQMRELQSPAVTPPVSPTSPPATPTVETKTFGWTKAGATLKYPAAWRATGFEGLNSSFSGNSDQVTFYSGQLSGGAEQDYFCVSFQLSNDDYALSGGSVVGTVSNGLQVYQKEAIYQGKDYVWAWLTGSNMRSLVTLPNDQKVLATAIYSCVQGDVGSAKLGYDQQVASTEYQQAIDILKSFSF